MTDNKNKIKGLTKDELTFYQNAAIAAMQGIQESGTKLSVFSDLFTKETAKLAFDMADSMLDEYKQRLEKISLKNKK